MTQQILLRRSSVAGHVPATLAVGEVAINTADGVVFIGTTGGVKRLTSSIDITAAINVAINAHLAATDPHAQYTTDAEVNALIDAQAALPINLLTNQDALRSTRPGITDLNAAIIGGFYEVPPTALNYPPFVSSILAHVQVIRHSNPAATWVKQIAFNYTDNETFTRTGINGTGIADATWSPWKKIPNVTDDFVSSLSASGYQKLPSGLIIQWGNGAAAPQPAPANVAPAGGANILPIAFPNATLFASALHWGGASSVPGVNANGGGMSSSIILSSTTPPTKTTVTFISGWNSVIGIKYMAIGY